MKFLYCPNPDDEVPIMLVNKHIGYDEKGVAGILGDIFQNEIMALIRNGKTKAEVWVNTPGGSVLEGWNIYGTITNINQSGKMQIDTLCIGIAASTGGWIFQSGKNRVMMDYGVLMMHNAHSSDENASDEGNTEINKSIATMLASKSGKSETEVLNIMNRTTFMTATECMANGFCDSVKDSGASTSMLTSVKSDMLRWEAANKYLNKILEVKTPDMSVDKLSNMLELNDDASEASKVKALQNIITAKDNAEKALKDLKNDMEDKLKKAKDEMDSKTNEYNDLKQKYDKLQKDSEDAAKAKNLADCENMVKDFANSGHIKNEEAVIKEWVDTAVTLGLDKAKTLIEANPINKLAPVYTPEADGKKTTSIASAMNNKLNKISEKK